VVETIFTGIDYNQISGCIPNQPQIQETVFFIPVCVACSVRKHFLNLAPASAFYLLNLHPPHWPCAAQRRGYRVIPDGYIS
jgi:hypothetical protein